GVITGLEILLRAFLPDGSRPMVQQTPVRSSQSIAKARHQLPAMPFHPANFVHRQFILPTACPFPAYTSEFALSRRVSCPEFSGLCRRYNDIPIKRYFQEIADPLHRWRRIGDQISVTDDNPRNFLSVGG